MDWTHAYHEFQLWWASCSWLEVIGSAAGLACVWLYGKESMWAWPTGIVSTFCFMYIFYEVRLYSDTALQVIFQILNVLGWYEWLKGGPQQGERAITRGYSLKTFMLTAWTVIAIQLGAGYYFKNCTQADLPYWDSAILALSLVAQWLLNRKVLENWLLWIAVDVLSIGVYFYKELYLTAILYGIFLALATKGFFEWKDKLKGVPAPVEIPNAETTTIST